MQFSKEPHNEFLTLWGQVAEISPEEAVSHLGAHLQDSVGLLATEIRELKQNQKAWEPGRGSVMSQRQGSLSALAAHNPLRVPGEFSA